MELEFDKEIDALMRKGLTGRVSTGEVFNAHLDADELSAFAENAMPEKSRRLYMAHLADCDRCRRILSNLIVLNTEAGIGTATIAAPAISAAVQPWYRRLFLFPNLAYVMGGLVLVFGGLLGVSVLQKSMSGDAVSVSQATDTQPAARGPMAPGEPDYSMPANASSNAAAMNSNSSAASSSATSNSAANAPGSQSGAKDADDEVLADNKAVSGITLDGADRQPAPAMPATSPEMAAPPPPKEAELRKDDKAKQEEKLAAMDSITAETAKRSANERIMRESPRSQAGGPMKSKSGASRDVQQQFPDRANNTFDVPVTKNVGGKHFQFRNGAWYDDAYRGQPTMNVRRKSDEYKRLDGGLRSIAESISGTVVIVWGAKAYRVQ